MDKSMRWPWLVIISCALFVLLAWGALPAVKVDDRTNTIDCATCCGNGAVYRLQDSVYWPDMQFYRWVECPECDGTGKVSEMGE